MKRLNKYMMLFVATFALVSCVDDVTDTPTLESKVGENVQFGLTLPSARTIYGPEDNNAFPIYWTEGDKVQIYSPECLEGRNNAEYKVIPANVEKPNYAEDLQITGANGVQWGESKANFYSIYPSKRVTFSSSSNAVTADVKIDAEQYSNNSIYNATWYAASMDNVIMYAQKNGVEVGNTVDLQYTPLSTVLEFELNVDVQKVGENQNPYIDIVSLTLTAPEDTYIAGDFRLAFTEDTPEITSISNGSNSIIMRFDRNATLNATNSKMKIKLALLPVSVTTLDDWTVTVAVKESAETTAYYTRTFKETGANTALKAGMVHKIKLPNLTAKSEWSYTTSKWMTELNEYQRIYLTELSIPGAWYAAQPEYQGSGVTVESLWNAGIRAFGIECRTTSKNRYNSDVSYVGISGTGSNNLLTGEQDYYWSADKLSDLIKTIATKVNGTNETAVLVLNYAYGARGGYRDVDFAFFLSGVQTAINDSKADNIVTSIDKDTTIGQVLNSLIIKINVDSRVSYDVTGVSSLFSSVPLAHELATDKVYFSPLKYGSWAADDVKSYTDNPTITDNSFWWCFSSANRTQLDSGTDTQIPTYKQRKDVLNEMMNHSKEIYEKSSHNVWFYFNCGGTQTTSLTANTNSSSAQSFATEMNSWLKGVVDNKVNGTSNDPSPLGIVMFNYCTNNTYNGPAIIKSIIDMNGKFGLKRAPIVNGDTDPDEEE